MPMRADTDQYVAETSSIVGVSEHEWRDAGLSLHDLLDLYVRILTRNDSKQSIPSIIACSYSRSLADQ